MRYIVAATPEVRALITERGFGCVEHGEGALYVKVDQARCAGGLPVEYLHAKEFIAKFTTHKVYSVPAFKSNSRALQKSDTPYVEEGSSLLFCSSVDVRTLSEAQRQSVLLTPTQFREKLNPPAESTVVCVPTTQEVVDLAKARGFEAGFSAENKMFTYVQTDGGPIPRFVTSAQNMTPEEFIAKFTPVVCVVGGQEVEGFGGHVVVSPQAGAHSIDTLPDDVPDPESERIARAAEGLTLTMNTDLLGRK